MSPGPSQTATSPISVAVTAAYTDVDAAWHRLFSFDGFGVALYTRPVDVASAGSNTSLVVPNVGVVSNNNGASHNAALAFRLTTNATGFASWAPNTSATLLFATDALGNPTVPTIGGVPLQPVSYAGLAGTPGYVSSPSPVTFGPTSVLTVGAATADASAFAGAISAVAVNDTDGTTGAGGSTASPPPPPPSSGVVKPPSPPVATLSSPPPGVTLASPPPPSSAVAASTCSASSATLTNGIPLGCLGNAYANGTVIAGGSSVPGTNLTCPAQPSSANGGMMFDIGAPRLAWAHVSALCGADALRCANQSLSTTSRSPPSRG